MKEQQYLNKSLQMQKQKWDGDSVFRFFEKTKGSICIFLALIMLPVMTLGGLVVDGSRISAARTNLSGAGDLALNAALSEYDQILYDIYGIFAVSEDMEELEKNVSIYFSNSINNSGILNDSDSYTREFINSIFGTFSGSEMEFNNIVEMEVADTFDLSGVSSSSIANPAVLERQIVDYMKYRGPINIGKGLLTKLGCIGETSKQTKALESKVDYDKKLDTVQEACETAYNAINSCNNLINNSAKYSQSGYLANLQNDIDSTKKDVETMVQYIAAKNSSKLGVESYYKKSYGYRDMKNILIDRKAISVFNVDSTVKKEVEKYYNNSKAKNKTIDTMDYIEKAISGSIKLKRLENGTYDYEETDFIKAMLKFDGTYKTDLGSQITDIINFNAVPSRKQIFTYTIMYCIYFDSLSEEEQKLYQAKKEAIETFAGILLGCSEFCYGYVSEWNGKANDNGKKASSRLYEWYKEIESIDTSLQDAIDALDAVVKKVDELDSARKTWSKNVNALSEGDIKTSMKGDYEASAKDINEDAINKLKGILEQNKKHFKAIKEALEGIKLSGEKICRSDYDSLNYSSKFSSAVGETTVDSPSAATSKAADVMKNKYTNKNVSGISPASFKKITEDGDDMQFYKYLVRVCASSDAESNKESKSEAKNLKKDLIETGNTGASSSAAQLPESVPDTIGSAIPEEVQKAMDDLFAVEDGKTDEFKAEKVPSDDDDSKIADKNKNNMTQISDLLESLGKIAEAGRDKLLVQEYMTEMFSCYTDTIEKDGVVTAKAMNGHDMTSNQFFGAEAEYILWGKDTVQSNLNSTKAMIFGIRFALNSIYAFTSADTRTPALTAATAIAGWTGFGVPIVQTVILLAWSMAESYVDVDCLCKGDAVALYKSKDTWFLGYGGIKSSVAEAIKTASNGIIDDVFAKIEDAAVDATGKITDNVEDTIKDYSQKTLRGIYDSVNNALTLPIQQLALQIAGASENLSRNDIVKKVENTLSGLKNSDSGLVNECINLAVDKLLSSEKTYIVDELVKIYNSAKNGSTIDAINELLYGKAGDAGLIGTLYGKIEDAVFDKVEEYGSKFENEVNAKISSGVDNAKESVKESINKFTAGIAGDASSTEAKSTSAASGFAMTYKEYVKTFIMINMIVSDSKKDAMLVRVAELMQANVSQKNSAFNIGKTYTMLQAKAAVNVKTTFFSIPIASENTDGTQIYGLDFSKLGNGWQKIEYTSILGY